MTGVNARTAERAAALKELAAQGLSMMEAAEKIGINRNKAVYIRNMFDVVFLKTIPRLHLDKKGLRARKKDAGSRELQMSALYKSGKTLEEIGRTYGLTRERVRQLLKRTDATASCGGVHIKKVVNRHKFNTARDQRYLSTHGCTYAQFAELRSCGRGERAPLGAFSRQKSNARIRGIGWELSLWQWWTIWQQSGHWSQRGRGNGYVMCRRGDSGPYALGNVFISTARENSSEGSRKADLPIGVSYFTKGKYETFKAKIQLDGKKLNLGSFKTPEAAHACYLMALNAHNGASQ